MERRHRREALAVSLWAAATAAAAFAPVLFGGGVFVFRDITCSFVPTKALAAAAWRSLSWPAWNPFSFCGMPLLAVPAQAVLYPPNALFLLFDPGRAMSLMLLLHFPLALAAMHLYLRGTGLGPWPAAVGATAYAWSGHALSDMAIVQFTVHPWMPLLLWSIGRAPRPVPVGAAVWAVAVTGGAAERLLLLAPLALAHAAFEDGRRGARRAAAALAAGTALAAPAWLPALLHATGPSARAVGLPRWMAVFDSVGPDRLWTTLLPVPLVGGDLEPLLPLWSGILPLHPILYLGAPVFLLAALAPSKPLVRFWLAAGVAGVLLAAGRHTPLYGWILDVCPPARLFRYPSKNLWLAAAALAVLAAHGAARLADAPARVRVLAAGAVLAALLLAAGPLVRATGGSASGAVAAQAPAAAAVALPFLAAATALASVGRLTPLRGAALAAVVFLDASAAALRVVPVLPAAHFDPSPTAAWVRDGRIVFSPLWEDGPPIPGLGRFASRMAWWRLGLRADLGILWGARYADGYDWPMAPPGAEAVFHAAEGLPDSGAESLGRRSVRWRLLPLSAPPPPPPWRLARSDTAVYAALYENPRALPRARIEGAPGGAKIVLDRPEEVVVEAEAASPAVLLLADSHAPGWTAEVDGAPAALRRSADGFREVDLPAGRSTVRFRYRPPGLTVALALSGIGAAFLVLARRLYT